MKVTPEFREAFYLVHEAFRTPPREIDECKAALVASDRAAAEAAYFATAAMIRAGWKPLTEQASAFLARQNVEP